MNASSNFASFNISGFGPSSPLSKSFKTTRNGADRRSGPVKMAAAHWDEKNRHINVFGEDGHLRVCKVDRLESIEKARMLWKDINEAGRNGVTIRFVAAGGFDPNKWFYTFEIAE